MKKILFIIICIFCSFFAIGQYTLNQQDTSEVMQLAMPKGTNKLNERQVKNLSYQRVKKVNISYLHKHIYKSENMLIYYGNFSSSTNFRKLSLEQKQKRMSSFNDEPTTIVIDSSKIITVNNIRFLILESHQEEEWSIHFISDYNKDDRYTDGLIEFKKSDDDKAWQYLQQLLKTMHFKKK